MTTLRQRMTEDMQLRGLRSSLLRDCVVPRTQEAYLRAVVQLVKYCRSVAFWVDLFHLRCYNCLKHGCAPFSLSVTSVRIPQIAALVHYHRA